MERRLCFWRQFTRPNRVVAWGAALVLLLASTVHAQNFSSTRIELNRYVRDLVGEPQATFVADTVVNRMIYYSHRATAMALGEMADSDIDTIVATQGKHEYTLSNDVSSDMVGRITGVSRRVETKQGGGDIGLVRVDHSQIGKLGEGVIPNSYAIHGEHLVLATRPTGTDTFFVYYQPLATDLTADGTALSIGGEDFEAVAFLAAAKILLRGREAQVGQAYFQMWQNMISMKRGSTGVQQ